MAKTDFQSVDEYLAALPEVTRDALVRVRAAIREGAPDAEEVISYQIPAYKFGGAFVLYVSGYAKHFSLSQPPLFAAFDRFKDDLARYKQSKSAVQFPLSEPVPVDLIRDMAKFQAEENLRLEAEKPPKPFRKKPSAGPT